MSDVEKKETDEISEPEKELTNIRPSKVSIVDLGANGEVFFVAKSANVDQQMTTKDLALKFFKSVRDRNNNVIEILKNAEVADVGKTSPFFQASVHIIRDHFIGGQAAFDFDSPNQISGSVRDKSLSMIESANSQLEDVINKIENSESTDSLPDISEELTGIAASFSSAVVAVDGGQTNTTVLTEDEMMKEETTNVETPTASVEIETVKALTETIMKSAKKDDELSVEVIQKQARMAADVLNDVLSTLAIEPSEMEGLDMWDIRYKIGESVSLLMDAAKLDVMLGSTSVEKSAPKVEHKKEDTGTMSTEEKKSKSAGSDASGDVTSEGAPQPSTSVDITSGIADAIKEALGPISQKIDDLGTRLESTEQIVEKMDRARVEPKGGDPEKTVQKGSGADQPESTFASIMPEHLTGSFRHGERVND